MSTESAQEYIDKMNSVKWTVTYPTYDAWKVGGESNYFNHKFGYVEFRDEDNYYFWESTNGFGRAKTLIEAKQKVEDHA